MFVPMETEGTGTLPGGVFPCRRSRDGDLNAVMVNDMTADCRCSPQRQRRASGSRVNERYYISVNIMHIIMA
jgi:hypothetical protein